MHVVYDIKNGDYIESESGERFQLYIPYDEQAIIKAWEFGLKEAWEAARELFTEEKNGCVSNKSIIKAFNGLCLNDIFRLYTAKEAVKEIKDYKEKKAEKDERMNENKGEEKKEKEMKSGDKFIIELGEKIKQYHETPDGKQNLIDTVYRIEGTNAAITEKDLQNLEEYKKKPTIPREEIEKEGYEKALNELWEALKQVNKMHLKDYEECTGERFKYNLYSKITPMEFVEKFKEWKEKKKEEEIKVGDEIENGLGTRAVVTRVTKTLHECLGVNGFFYLSESINLWKKTEKHYDEVEKIFQKLKESEGEIPFL